MSKFFYKSGEMTSSRSTMEELEGRYAEIRLEEEEEGGVVYENVEDVTDEIDVRWCLVGKLLSDRPVDFEVLRNMMAALWRPGRGMYVKELGTNLFLFQFFHEVDIQRAMEGSP